MKTLRALLLVLAACEATAPASRPAPAPTPAPAPVSPTPTPKTPAGPTEGEVAGIHYVEWVRGVPAGSEADARLPMVVVIHGLGDNPMNFTVLIQDLEIPARFIFPRALDPYETGWSWFPRRARDPDVAALSEGIATAADKLAPAIDALAEQRPTVGKPIVTGFSQGGMLAFTLATRHANSFSASFPVGGWLPPPLWPNAAGDFPPIVALHGDADRAVVIEPTREAVRHLEGLGVKVELHEYPGVPHLISPPMREELYGLLRGAVEGIAKDAPQ